LQIEFTDLMALFEFHRFSFASSAGSEYLSLHVMLQSRRVLKLTRGFVNRNAMVYRLAPGYLVVCLFLHYQIPIIAILD
jgi:hypothetical protein